MTSSRLLCFQRFRLATALWNQRQEDWGWFLWSASDGLRLAVDIFTDDHSTGLFRAHLSTSKRGLLGDRKEPDTPALEELMQVVNGALTSWLGSAPLVDRVD